jgi:hypothetical protein
MNNLPFKAAATKSFLMICVSLAIPNANAAVIVEAHGGLYEIETTSGLLGTLKPTIKNQPWYGDSLLAGALANAVAEQLGRQQYSQLGPMFGFHVYDGVGADYTTSMVYKVNIGHAQEQNAAAGVWTTYATGKYVGASAVPEPSATLLSLAAVITIAAFRKKPSGSAPHPLRSPA